MSEDATKRSKIQWQKYRFVGMLSAVIAISLVLTGVSLEIYNTSGAAQVDLSRPGYQSVRKEATLEQPNDQFEASGNLDDKSYEKFYEMYDRHAGRSADVSSFGDQALSDESLQIFADSGAQQQESAEDIDEPAN